MDYRSDSKERPARLEESRAGRAPRHGGVGPARPGTVAAVTVMPGREAAPRRSHSAGGVPTSLRAFMDNPRNTGQRSCVTRKTIVWSRAECSRTQPLAGRLRVGLDAQAVAVGRGAQISVSGAARERPSQSTVQLTLTELAEGGADWHNQQASF